VGDLRDTFPLIQGQQCPGAIRHTLNQLSILEDLMQILPVRLA
jgi:hypothetical protein